MRTALLALMGVVLLNGSLLAQRGRGGVGGHAGIRGHAIGRAASGAGGFARRNGSGSYLAAYDGGGYESTAGDAPPPVVVVRAPERPISNGLVTEVPAVANSTVPKVLPPPTIFILASGERIESRRFVLTASELSVNIDRERRNVPMRSLDIQATIAANHERGVELRIPDDRSEISLGF